MDTNSIEWFFNLHFEGLITDWVLKSYGRPVKEDRSDSSKKEY